MLLALLLAGTGCTKVIAVPPSHYRDPEHGVSYRVHTTGGTTYYVADFTADDSTLTILRFRHIHNEEVSPPPTPFGVPLAQVNSVERVMPSDNVPLVLGGIFLVIVVLGAAAAAVGCSGCN